MTHGKHSEPGYHLPLEAHEELQALRQHLHLLAQLSIPETAKQGSEYVSRLLRSARY